MRKHCQNLRLSGNSLCTKLWWWHYRVLPVWELKDTLEFGFYLVEYLVTTTTRINFVTAATAPSLCQANVAEESLRKYSTTCPFNSSMRSSFSHWFTQWSRFGSSFLIVPWSHRITNSPYYSCISSCSMDSIHRRRWIKLKHASDMSLFLSSFGGELCRMSQYCEYVIQLPR